MAVEVGLPNPQDIWPVNGQRFVVCSALSALGHSKVYKQIKIRLITINNVIAATDMKHKKMRRQTREAG